MDERMKQRAVGGVVLVALLVIFVPMFFDFGGENAPSTGESVVPPLPQTDMTSVELPLKELADQQVGDAMPPPNVTPEQLLAEVGEIVSAAREGDTPPDVVALGEEPAPAAAAPAPAVPAPVAKAAKPATPVVPPLAKAEAPKSKVVEPKPKPQLVGPKTGAKAWAVQVGSFAKRESADKLAQRLRKSGYRAFVATTSAGGKTVVRVRIGPELQRANADSIRKKVEKDLHLQAMVVEHP